MTRTSIKNRKTKETEVTISFGIDGSGQSKVDTGIGFFDHMLQSFAKHGLFDLEVQVVGDLNVDGHHTVEDTGIVLGQAIKDSLGDQRQIVRYSSCMIPMDDALVLCAVDLCSRPYLVWDAPIPASQIGTLDTELVREFFYAISYSAGMNLHIKVLHGHNSHHIVEAMFKAFARALDEATRLDDRIQGVKSTKGSV